MRTFEELPVKLTDEQLKDSNLVLVSQTSTGWKYMRVEDDKKCKPVDEEATWKRMERGKLLVEGWSDDEEIDGEVGRRYRCKLSWEDQSATDASQTPSMKSASKKKLPPSEAIDLSEFGSCEKRSTT